MDGLLRHLATQDPDSLDDLIRAVQLEDSNAPDLSTFDFSSVPVKRSETWVLQMMPFGYKTRRGDVVDDYVEGSQPIFKLFICRSKCSFLESR